MAWRYRGWPIVDGNILDPWETWNLPMAEYAEEMNGYFDRDNLGLGWVDFDHVVRHAFHEVRTGGSTTVGTIDITMSQWTASLSVGSMPSSSFELPADAFIEAHLGVQVIQTFASILSVHGPATSRGVRFRILINGEEVARSGWVDVLHEYDRIYLCGATVRPAGAVSVVTEFQAAQVGYDSGQTVSWWNRNGEADPSDPTIDQRELVVIRSAR